MLNSIGLCFVIFYTTITLSILIPFRCFDQPVGPPRLVAFPAVECSMRNHTYATMVAVMVLLLLIFPVGTLAVCGWLVCAYARRSPSYQLKIDQSPSLREGRGGKKKKCLVGPVMEGELLRASRFLFQRWSDERCHTTGSSYTTGSTHTSGSTHITESSHSTGSTIFFECPN